MGSSFKVRAISFRVRRPSTADIGRALRVARAVQAGTFWINQYGTIELEMPFGGFKQSGFGRELGIESVLEYTELKSIHLQL